MSRRTIDFDSAINGLLTFVASTEPALNHIQPELILSVLGEARRRSRASIRPLMSAAAGRKHKRPTVELNGQRMRYLLTLRPLFFRTGDAALRVRTILHELLHVSTGFDGTLELTRRHQVMGPHFDELLSPLFLSVWGKAPRRVIAPFSHEGYVEMLQWLERPSVGVRHKGRRKYTEKQLFRGLIAMTEPSVVTGISEHRVNAK